jgi:predicted DNA-binding protein
MEDFRNVNFVISNELYESLAEVAKQEERSISWIVRKAIQKYVEVVK